MALQLWDLGLMERWFSGGFLDIIFPPGGHWILTMIIYLAWIYIIKKGGFDKSLYVSIPLFLFGSLFLLAFYGFEAVKYDITIMITTLIFMWLIHTRLVHKFGNR